MGKQRTPNIIQTNILPALRFAGNPGITTSRDRGSGLPPALWHRASPAAWGCAPRSQPEGSQDTRSRSAAEFSGPCQQQPVRVGYGYPKLYRTDPFAISKWRQPRAGRCSLSSERRSRNGFTGVPLTGKVPVSPENGRKQLPAPTGILCLSEQI